MLSLERRMGHLARLYAARARYNRVARQTSMPGLADRLYVREWAIDDAIDRAKLPYYAGVADRAIVLLAEARAADCFPEGK